MCMRVLSVCSSCVCVYLFVYVCVCFTNELSHLQRQRQAHRLKCSFITKNKLITLYNYKQQYCRESFILTSMLYEVGKIECKMGNIECLCVLVVVFAWCVWLCIKLHVCHQSCMCYMCEMRCVRNVIVCCVCGVCR